MTRVAGQWPELVELVVVEKKKKSVRRRWVQDARKSVRESPGTCFLTGVWRATVLLGPTPAAINPLRALCPYAFQPLLTTLVLSSFSPFTLSLSSSLPRSVLLYIPHHLHPHQNAERDNPSLFSFYPIGSFPPFFSHSIVLHLFLFLCLFLLSFGIDFPSFSH